MSSEKWIVGTGFTRGIGHEFAKKIHAEGYKIIHLGRNKIGFENEYIHWDLLNSVFENSLEDLKKILLGKNIAGFFYSAGLMPMLEIHSSNEEQKKLFWQSQINSMRVNYLSCAELVEEIIPFLISSASSQNEKLVPFVAHLSSLAALDPFPGLELYGGSKAAALHYFTWLSKRFNATKLTCLSIHPGTVQTDMVNNIIQHEQKNLPVVQLLNDINQKNKLTLPSESAHMIFDFIFHKYELKINSHGKLFLIDTNRIHSISP